MNQEVMNLFNPVAQLPLVEVVRGAQTREEEVRKACAFVTAISKLPLIVKDCAGFLVNRVLAPYMMEAVRLYQQGEPREKIDQAAMKFGCNFLICSSVADVEVADADLFPPGSSSQWQRC